MTRVAVEPFSLPLSESISTAAGTIDRREGYLLRVGSEDGTVGLGEATPLPGWTESREDCRAALDSVTGHLADGDFETAVLETAHAPAASHAVSLARADRLARRDGVPLYRHLGHPGADGRVESAPVESVPVNATIGDGPIAETVARAEAAVAAGFDCVKVKVGVRPVPADVNRLRAVREAVGPDVALRADANAAWDRDRAAAALDELADLDLDYVEQPLSPDDLHGHAALRGGPIRIALDETLADTPVRDAIEVGAADVVVLKPMALGGVGRARRAAMAAREAGVEAVVTTTFDAAVARTAAVHLAASIPGIPACGLATADRLGDDLAPDPAPVEAGSIRVPQNPGLGVEAGRWA